jgi:NAD+ kinase
LTFQFNKVALIGIHTNPEVSETVFNLHQMLSNDVMVIVEEETATMLSSSKAMKTMSLSGLANTCDLAIIIGGDGNFLNVARNLSNFSEIPMIGINKGKLGFLTDISPFEIETRLLAVLRGEYSIEERFMITAQIHCDNEFAGKACAFNEIMIAAGQKSRLFELDIHIDGKHAFSQRSDGIIVATPTGSTAHALSAGGPIMYPSLDAISLVPMFSHSLNSRPIVINANSVIDVRVGEYNHPEPLLSFDGHSHLNLKPNSVVSIRKCNKRVKVLHPLDYDYYKSLRTKLHWSKMLF